MKESYHESLANHMSPESGAAILGYHLAAYHLNLFHNTGTTNMFNSTITNTMLAGDDYRLEHRVGVNWGEDSAMAPHVFYPGFSMVDTKIRGNSSFITSMKSHVTNNNAVLLQAALDAEGSVEVALNITNSVINFDSPHQSAFYQDVYNAFGKAVFNGVLTVLAEIEEGELKVSNAIVDGFLTDLYDWDYTFRDGGDALTFDDELAIVQAGYPNLGNMGMIFQMTAEVSGEVDL